MQRIEYKVVPAPARGEKIKGVKATGDRFANTIETTLNEYAADGWSFLRAEILPCEERSGLTGRITSYQNLLVFQRPTQDADDIDQTNRPFAETAQAEPEEAFEEHTTDPDVPEQSEHEAAEHVTDRDEHENR